MVVHVEATGLTQVHRQLKTLGDHKTIRRALNKNLKVAAQPAAASARAAVLSIPTKGPGTGLRGRIAAGIKVKVSSSSVRIASTGRLAPEMEGVEPRWRHPVYGNREVWVQQPPRPTFFKAIRPHQAAFDRAAQQSMDDALREAGL